MIYSILISIVFIAEVIIAVTIIQNILRLDKAVSELDDTISLTKRGIKDICTLGRKISQQLIIISEDFADKVVEARENLLLKIFIKSITAILLLKLNFKIVNKFRKSKVVKTFAKGLSFLANMV